MNDESNLSIHSFILFIIIYHNSLERYACAYKQAPIPRRQTANKLTIPRKCHSYLHCEYESPFTMNSSPTAGTDRQNSFKYVFRRDEFRRVPRWPNDGIDQLNDSLLKEREPDMLPSTGHTNADQRFLTEMYGGYWNCTVSLSSLQPASKYQALCLPFCMQLRDAETKRDHAAAQSHLMEQYKEYNQEIRELLKQIQCKIALHKAGRNPTRFPGVRAILYALFQHQLACEDNIQLLFGDLFRVLADVLEIGAEFAEPPPANTPAGAMRAKMLPTGSVAAAPKECANCGTQQGVSDRCICKSIYYCSKDCQNKHWKVHRPDCHKIRGLVVTPEILQRARNEVMSQHFQRLTDKMDTYEAYQQRLGDSFWAMLDEEGYQAHYSHDCVGKKKRADLPFSAPYILKVTAPLWGLEYETELNLAILPEGINQDLHGQFTLIRDPATNATILILTERLFADNGNGEMNGHSLEGIYVVSKINKKKGKGEAVWKKVAEPIFRKDKNRYLRFVHYLQVAMEQAKAVPDDVDLGIDKIMPKVQTTPTQFGDYFHFS
jgi:MYND finger